MFVLFFTGILCLYSSMDSNNEIDYYYILSPFGLGIFCYVLKKIITVIFNFFINNKKTMHNIYNERKNNIIKDVKNDKNIIKYSLYNESNKNSFYKKKKNF